MAQKQGGKGKQSSQSDKNYWSRISSRPGKVSARKAANQKRSGINVCTYGKIPRSKKPAESAIFSQSLIEPRKRQDGRELSLIICNGILLDITPRETDAAIVAGSILPGLGWTHTRLNPLSGRNTLIASRNFR